MTNPTDPTDFGSHEKEGGVLLSAQRERNITRARGNKSPWEEKRPREFPVWECGGQRESPASSGEGTGLGE